MAKINLTKLPEEEQLRHIRKYHKNKCKQAFGQGHNQDPYLTTRNVCKKFIITPEKSEYLLRIYRKEGLKRSAYVELNFI